MHAWGATSLPWRSPPSTQARIGGCVGIDTHPCVHGVLLGAHDVAGISHGTQRLRNPKIRVWWNGRRLRQSRAGADLRAHGTPRSPLTWTFVELTGLEPAAFCLQTITPPNGLPTSVLPGHTRAA